MGDKIRSIDGISGVGVFNFQKILNIGLAEHVLQEETTNPEIIGDIFHDGEMKEEFVNNYYCTSILPMYQDLTSSQIGSILVQLTDRIDINSLNMLNSTKFYNHPLLLEGLLL